MSGQSRWRSASTADEYPQHDYADFAQEFLRRNTDYQREYIDIKGRAMDEPSITDAEQEGLAGLWGLQFPFRP